MELASSSPSCWASSLLKNPNHCSLLLGRVLRLCVFSRKRIIERAHWGSATSLSSGVVVFTRSCFLSRLLLILLGSLERAYLSLSLVELLLHKSKVRKKKKKEDYGQRKNDLITTPLVSGNNGNGISNVGSSSNNGGRTRGTGSSSGGSGSRSSGVQGAARYLRRAGSRGVMREPSVLVRESAAEHLEERQNDWAYSRPVVVLDLIWNLAFLLVAVAVVILSKDERPRVPLRLWITGYALQCIVHMVCVSLEYRRRRQPQQLVGASSSSSTLVETSASQDAAQAVQDAALDDNVAPSLAKQLESGNTMFSFVWWMFGFGLIISGGEVLIHEAPRLYWLCIVFLAFDVLFVVFCIALAFVIGIAVCCCLPCIIAILYAVAEEKGASEEEINALAKYKFRRTGSDNSSLVKSAPFSGVMSLMGTSDRVTERTIAGEDAECCICLSQYEDGVEVREIPCSHHFHATCVDKWLRINATCPLCKHNIIHGNNNINNRHQEEV